MDGASVQTPYRMFMGAPQLGGRALRICILAVTSLSTSACQKGAGHSPTTEQKDRAAAVTISDCPTEVEGSSATITFAGPEDASFVCWLDRFPLEPCETAAVLSDLAPGEHELLIAAVAAGDGSFSAPAVCRFQVLGSLVIQVLQAPSAQTPRSEAVFEVQAPGADHFSWELDGAEPVMAGGLSRWSELALGLHEMVVTAIGDAGEQGEPVRLSWEVIPLPIIKARSVSIGYRHGCVVTADGRLGCFGDNEAGQLGEATNASREGLCVVDIGEPWEKVACGRYHTCALTQAGALYCWGLNSEGQTSGPSSDRGPHQVSAGTQWTDLAVGAWHTCAIDSQGAVFCFGLGASGQLGDGLRLSSRDPVQIASTGAYESITAGAGVTCAIRADQALWCWGINTENELNAEATDTCDLGTTTVSCAAAPVMVAGSFRAASAHSEHVCGIDAEGRLDCWGANAYGQCGSPASPTAVSSLEGSWNEVAAGGSHTCAIDSAGDLFCFGDNSMFQLGVTSPAQSPSLLQTGSDGQWKRVVAGPAGVCAIDVADDLWCFGATPWGTASNPEYVDLEDFGR